MIRRIKDGPVTPPFRADIEQSLADLVALSRHDLFETLMSAAVDVGRFSEYEPYTFMSFIGRHEDFDQEGLALACKNASKRFEPATRGRLMIQKRMIADFIINDGLTRQHIAFIGINDFNANPSFFLLFSTLRLLASDSSLDIRVYSLAPLTPCELREKLTSILGRNIFFDLSEHETPEQQVAEILRSGPHVVVNVAGHTEGGLYEIMNILSQILHLVLVVFLGCPFDYGELPNQTCVVTLTDDCVSKNAASMFFPDHHKFLRCYQVNSHKDVHGDVNELQKGISLKDFGIEEGIPIIACIVRQSRCNFETMCMYMELLKRLPTAIFFVF
jgi:hypothetical protein